MSSTTLNDLDTPALIVDLDRLEANIGRMAAVAREGGKALRPHTKTHKTPEIARMQVAAGARGITVAKLGEAEVMAGAGFDDIFIANQIVGPIKLERLVPLAKRARIIVGVDDAGAAQAIAEAAHRAGVTVEVRIEVDTGLRRAGVRTVEAAADLAATIAETPGVRLDGLFTYEGHANAGSPEERERTCRAAAEQMRSAAEAIQKRGIDPGVLSVGSTAGAPTMTTETGISELRPGVYVFNDCGQMARGARIADCALTVLATVVSRPDTNTAIIDAGTKALSGDKGVEGSRHGRLLEDADVVFDWANEEHGHLNLSGSSFRPRIGDQVRIVPFHACTATNMHDTVHAVRGERVEASWNIAGRGRIQ
jgi:D-serine deaminase-like pyridoxal phosphate-dependent protein